MVKRLSLIITALALLLASSISALAQVQVTGTVLEEGSDEPMPSVAVYTDGGASGTYTESNGSFQLNVAAGSQLTVSFIGYETLTLRVPASARGSYDFGKVYMATSAIGLDEVRVIASVVPKDRLTPVPVSNVTMKAIQTQAPNIEFPELLKATPSVYVTKGGGGFGDSRINLRGFDSNNIGVLINGVPINDMESGKVYWSNWAGLNDVSSFIQVQRGLGASKLGLSSVGGTINMVTKSTDAKKGGSIYTGVGNDGFLKTSFNVSTGLMDNGWAISLAGSRSQGDGYVDGTNFVGWSYFVNVSKRINDHHRLSFTAFGAPQWHNQRGQMYLIEDYHNAPEGRRLNRGYGYINGRVEGGAYARNFYHKPQISLNHYWDINKESSIYTSIYASISNGGGRRIRGAKTDWLTLDYNTGRPKDPAAFMGTPDGLLDFDRVMEANKASNNGSYLIFSNAMNSHNWYGLLSYYTNKFSDLFKLTAGFDGRFYQGIHREVIEDLLGGEYYIEPQNSSTKLMYHNPYQPLQVGDYIQYDNIGEVLWNGLFAQGEFTGENFNAFISGAVSHKGYRYVNLGGTGEKYDALTPPDKIVSPWATYLPWSVKAGASYKFLEHSNVFVNAGYFTIAPYFRNVFFRYNTTINTGAKYERVFTGEVGYGFKMQNLRIDLNGYYTKWLDKSLTRSMGNNTTANISGLDARHAGVELEATYTPIKPLDIRFMFSWGDWIWADDVKADVFDDAQQYVGTINAFVKGVHVGNSAQMTSALGISWEALKDFRLKADLNYAGKNYADFDPTNRTKETDKVDAWRIPDYCTLDLGANYRFNIGSCDATVYINVNNVTNTEYISDARDGKNHDMQSALVYYGFGTNWATGLRINF